MKKELTFANMLYMQDKVVNWNKIFGINSTDSEFTTLYGQLTSEECFGEGELLDSLEKDDQAGVLDALIDLVFTGFQWSVLSGVSLEEYEDKWFNEDVVTGTFSREILVDMLAHYIKQGSASSTQTILVNLLYQYSEVFDIMAAFERVLESNMSKAIHVEKHVDIKQEVAMIEEQGRYGDITFNQQGDYFIFKAGKDLRENVTFDKPKIIKSTHFKSVEDLGGLEEFIL